MPPESRDDGAQTPTVEQSIVYLRDMLAELAQIARKLGLRDLAHFIDIGHLEATVYLKGIDPAQQSQE